MSFSKKARLTPRSPTVEPPYRSSPRMQMLRRAWPLRSMKKAKQPKQSDQLSGGKNTLVLRTLAAAYAENGEFGKAIETARAAMHLARMDGGHSLAVELEQEIALYQLAMPYRETRK